GPPARLRTRRFYRCARRLARAYCSTCEPACGRRVLSGRSAHVMQRIAPGQPTQALPQRRVDVIPDLAGRVLHRAAVLGRPASCLAAVRLGPGQDLLDAQRGRRLQLRTPRSRCSSLRAGKLIPNHLTTSLNGKTTWGQNRRPATAPTPWSSAACPSAFP